MHIKLAYQGKGLFVNKIKKDSAVTPQSRGSWRSGRDTGEAL
jgi:hypothetical protein